MSSTKLWRNQGEIRFFQQLCEAFEDETVDAVFIAVAFLTSGGLALIHNALKVALNRNTAVNIVAGTDFFQTEPRALRSLHEMLGGRPDCHLGMFSAGNSGVFHPKVYAFQKSGKGLIAIGSANLTGGGLSINEEVGATLEVSLNSEEWIFIKNMFGELVSDIDYIAIDEKSLDDYEEAHQTARPKIERFRSEIADLRPRKRPSLSIQKTELLETLIDEYRGSSAWRKDFFDRKERYRKARVLLNEILDNENLPGNRVFDIYNELVGNAADSQLWSSTGISRHKGRVQDSPETFRNLVIEMSRNDSSPANFLFDIGQGIGRGHGIGPNGITETLHTLFPYVHCIVNGRSVGAMREFGWYGENAISFDGSAYLRFRGLLADLREKYHFESMIEVDNFLYFLSLNRVV